MVSKNTHDALNSLYQTLQDSRNGYQECAERVADEVATLRFRDLSNKRQQMLEELKSTVSTKGENLEEKGSLTAAAHRIFVDIKSLFTRGDRKAIVNEIERGENYLLDTYKKALNEDLTLDIRSLLENQAQAVQNDLISVKEFYARK